MLKNILKAFGYEKVATAATQPESLKICSGLADQLKRLKTEQLNQLEAALEKVPNNAQGFGGSAFVYENGGVRVVTVNSKQDALDLLHKARRGELDLVF